MSKRESRTSTGARQTDALLEFETFKKKFLLANKHITKLNSTLSVRIEELNAQISSLYVENLRLRASEIALSSQLKREREKSRKVMAEAEAATYNLTKHLTYLRQSFGISTRSPTPPAPASPRARRRPSNPNPTLDSPQGNRVSRPPCVPEIFEEEEPFPSSPEELEPRTSPLPWTTKPRLSGSRLPLPARETSPPSPLQHRERDQETQIKASSKPRKPSRRQSGLLSRGMESLSVPRSPSPAFGSPIRRQAALEEEDEIATVAGQLVEVDIEVSEIQLPVKRRKSRGKEKEKPELLDQVVVETDFPWERTRTKERREEENQLDGGSKPRLKGLTNSRPALSSIGNTVRDQDVESEIAKLSLDPFAALRSLSPPPPTDADSAPAGRERRARKSVNYTEPKLNTKMRKPDPPPGTVPPAKAKKRSSAAAVLTSTTYKPIIEDDNDGDNDAAEARSSLEQQQQQYQPPPPPLHLRLSGTVINPASIPLPPSRPPSSASFFIPPQGIVRTSSSTTAASSSSSSSSSSTTTSTVSRKKPKSQLVVEDVDDEDSDGAQGDNEHAGGKNWVNVEGRRKVGSWGLRKNMLASDDGRRHSMAV